MVVELYLFFWREILQEKIPTSTNFRMFSNVLKRFTGHSSIVIYYDLHAARAETVEVRGVYCVKRKCLHQQRGKVTKKLKNEENSTKVFGDPDKTLETKKRESVNQVHT